MNFIKNATFVRNTIISFIIILSSSAAFGLGRLSILMSEKEPLSIENYSSIEATSSLSAVEPPPEAPTAAAPASQKRAISSPPPPPTTAPKAEIFIASRTGKSYYFPWCGTVKRIKKENQITFNSRPAAEAAGYKPGNCAGLNK